MGTPFIVGGRCGVDFGGRPSRGLVGAALSEPAGSVGWRGPGVSQLVARGVGALTVQLPDARRFTLSIGFGCVARS